MKGNGRVSNKVALVTGGSLGIGRATAMLLAHEGAAVAVADVLGEPATQLIHDIHALGGCAYFYHMDVTSEEGVRETFQKVQREFGNVTILVNNAGVSGANKPTHELTVEEWDHVMDVNVKGVFLCTKYAIPQMLAAGEGSIINLSSIYGLVSAPDVPAYHASKGAVRLMTKTDALLYAPHGIRVNSVHPGFIWTPMVEAFLKEQGNLEQGIAAVGALHPLGHMGEPDDIAYGVLYLASNESKFVTGTELVIDGGYTAK